MNRSLVAVTLTVCLLLHGCASQQSTEMRQTAAALQPDIQRAGLPPDTQAAALPPDTQDEQEIQPCRTVVIYDDEPSTTEKIASVCTNVASVCTTVVVGAVVVVGIVIVAVPLGILMSGTNNTSGPPTVLWSGGK
jgi:hypothetical protein